MQGNVFIVLGMRASLRGCYSAFAIWFDWHWLGTCPCVTPAVIWHWRQNNNAPVMRFLWGSLGNPVLLPQVPFLAPLQDAHSVCFLTDPVSQIWLRKPLDASFSAFMEPKPRPSKCGPWTTSICITWGIVRNANLKLHSRPTKSGSLPWAQESEYAKFLGSMGLEASLFIHSRLEYARTNLPGKKGKPLGRHHLSSQFEHWFFSARHSDICLLSFS